MDNANYYKHQRPELVQYIKEGNNRILDVGCAEGALGELLKQRGMASEVVGIELFSGAAKMAESKLDRVICGDLEAIKQEGIRLELNTFDYIICGDVLEHLREPWDVLRWLVSTLKEDGRVIVSVPNVRYWGVSLPLVFSGKWEYRSEGILDRTHLRFFTKQTFSEMIMGVGLSIEILKPVMYRRLDRMASMSTFGLLDGLFGFQWLVVARKDVS